ncbi:MAG: hypothetical protein ACO1QS_05870 [Verrucomicrobiota bacterium]
MKISLGNATHTAFTAKELIVIIAVIALLVTLVGEALLHSKRIALRTTCASNQKQIALSFKMFAGDCDQIFPVDYFTSRAYRYPSNYNRPVWEYFRLASNELGTAKILICPKDVLRLTNAVKVFTNTVDGLAHPTRQNISISYFLGMSAQETKPNTLAVGDRNLALNSIAPFYDSPGEVSVVVASNSVWRSSSKEPFHKNEGFYALSDGSVQRADNARLQEALRLSRQSYGTNANRFLFPQ